MWRRWVSAVSCLAVCLSGAVWLGADPPANTIGDAPVSLMHSKLGNSQRVLEGLVRSDFEQIAQGARELKLISEAAEWPRPRDSVYEHFSAEFRRQCNQLEDLATKRNQQGATFTYLQMTTLCIGCHDHVRDSLRIAEKPGRGEVQLIPSQWPERELH